MKQLTDGLNALGLTFIPSYGNFVTSKSRRWAVFPAAFSKPV